MSLANVSGIFPNVPFEDYRRIDRVNWTWLRHMQRSPAHFKAAPLTPQVDTDAKRLGRGAHVALLEPQRFPYSYTVWGGKQKRGAEWEALKQQHGAGNILTQEQHRLCLAMADAAKKDEHASKHLRRGSAEVTLQWTDADTGISCKARLDKGGDVPAIVDVKTCRDASPSGFARACWNLDYAAQAAFYVDGHAAATNGELLPYVLVAIESEAPHVVQVYRVPDYILDIGRDTYRPLLERLVECRRDNVWPGYADGELELELPRWARPSPEEENVADLGLVVQQ